MTPLVHEYLQTDLGGSIYIADRHVSGVGDETHGVMTAGVQEEYMRLPRVRFAVKRGAKSTRFLFVFFRVGRRVVGVE